ncbi:hypothetical protein C7433_102516 [Pantoea sp. PNA 03-3]|nr:hypothetical protein C7433_102516 [Pantoea sp. PNA 03-3]
MGVLMWQFDDQPNTAVIANRKIFTSGEWISCVCHDSEDGGTPERGVVSLFQAFIA